MFHSQLSFSFFLFVFSIFRSWIFSDLPLDGDMVVCWVVSLVPCPPLAWLFTRYHDCSERLPCRHLVAHIYSLLNIPKKEHSLWNILNERSEQVSLMSFFRQTCKMPVVYLWENHVGRTKEVILARVPAVPVVHNEGKHCLWSNKTDHTW